MSAPAPIDFWFDFGSPYAFFAARHIDALAARHGRPCTWHPFMLGVAFRTTGMGPLITQPLRGEYALRDWARLARRARVPFTLPPVFPPVMLAASRAFYWLDSLDPTMARRFGHAVFDATFGQGRDLGPAAAVAELAAGLGLEREAVLAAAADPLWKDRLKRETDAALAQGIFGSPFVVVDGEPFWGHDRLPDVDSWLATGGW